MTVSGVPNTTCTIDGCDRPVWVKARRLCSAHYQQAWKAGTLPPLPRPRRRRTPGPHTCTKHPEPCPSCYSNCGCGCTACLNTQTAKQRRRSRQQAYGTYDSGMVDAEPVRRHVQQLRTRGMGKRRIIEKSGIAPGVMNKLIHGDPTRGQPPSRRVTRRNAEKLLAVTFDLADGAFVDAGPVRRQIDELVSGGFAKAELGRYLTGDPNTKTLQIGVPARGLVTAGNARQIAELHRRWKSGQIAPRGRRSRYDQGPPPTVPLEVGGHDDAACEDCGAVSLAGGRWCWPCFSVRATGARPTGCGTDAGYTAHRRRGERPCQACRDAHTLAQQLRQEAA